MHCVTKWSNVVPWQSNCSVLKHFDPQQMFSKEFCFNAQPLAQFLTILIKPAWDTMIMWCFGMKRKASLCISISPVLVLCSPSRLFIIVLNVYTPTFHISLLHPRNLLVNKNNWIKNNYCHVWKWHIYIWIRHSVQHGEVDDIDNTES